MTKLEKNIISAINTLESNEDIEVRKNGFFIKLKGVLQNFAILIDDHLFIRIDTNCYGICKKIFKNIRDIDYTICLGTDVSSKLLINNLEREESIDMIPDIFHHYNKYLMGIFKKYNLDFKEYVNNTIEIFDIHNEYEDMISDEKFWGTILNHRKKYDWWSNTTVSPTNTEIEELNSIEWILRFRTDQRNKSISNLLE